MDNSFPTEEGPKSAQNRRRVAPSIIIGLVLALFAIGLPMIGITVNIYLGAAVLLLAFILLAYGFWCWETAIRWGVTARVSTLWALGIVYFLLIGIQIVFQYRKDHPRNIAAPYSPVQSVPSAPSSGLSESPHHAESPPADKENHQRPLRRDSSARPKSLPPPPAAPQTASTPQPNAAPIPSAPITQECPGGICSVGPNNGSQTVINNAPPPPKITFSAQYWGKEVKVFIMTDRPVSPGLFAFFFSGPVKIVFDDNSPEAPYVRGAFGQQIGWGHVSDSTGLQVPNAIVVRMIEPQIFTPQMQFIVAFTYESPVQLTKLCNLSEAGKCISTGIMQQ